MLIASFIYTLILYLNSILSQQYLLSNCSNLILLLNNDTSNESEHSNAIFFMGHKLNHVIKLFRAPYNKGLDRVGHFGFCRQCGIAAGERVPPLPLGWYLVILSSFLVIMMILVANKTSKSPISNAMYKAVLMIPNYKVLCPGAQRVIDQ